MKNYTLDNSVDDLKKVVLWQYDNAHRLLAVLHMMKSYYDAAIKTFWDTWIANVLTIDTCTEFGAVVLGKLLGASRPIIIGEDGLSRSVSLVMFRRFLRLQIRLMSMNATLRDIAYSYERDGGEVVKGYLQLLFSVNDDYTRCGVSVADSQDMAIEFVKTSEYNNLDYDQKAVFEQLGNEFLPYPIGVKYNAYANHTAFSFTNTVLPQTLVFGESAEIVSGMTYIHIENGATVEYVANESFFYADTDTWEDIKGHFTLVGIISYVNHKTAFSPSELSALTYQPFVQYESDELLKHEGRYYNVDVPISQEDNTGWDAMANITHEITQSVGLTDTRELNGE